jgi:hypothetical protein
LLILFGDGKFAVDTTGIVFCRENVMVTKRRHGRENPELDPLDFHGKNEAAVNQ